MKGKENDSDSAGESENEQLLCEDTHDMIVNKHDDETLNRGLKAVQGEGGRVKFEM